MGNKTSKSYNYPSWVTPNDRRYCFEHSSPKLICQSLLDVDNPPELSELTELGITPPKVKIKLISRANYKNFYSLPVGIDLNKDIVYSMYGVTKGQAAFFYKSIDSVKENENFEVEFTLLVNLLLRWTPFVWNNADTAKGLLKNNLDMITHWYSFNERFKGLDLARSPVPKFNEPSKELQEEFDAAIREQIEKDLKAQRLDTENETNSV